MMKYVFSVVFIGLYLPSSAFCNGLYAKKHNNEIVYTNINTRSFFKRVFTIAKEKHYSKNRVINLIKKIAVQMGVQPKLAISIAKIESDFNHNSVSSSGAKGVMQLMDKTAKFYGVKDINNLKENIKGGIRFLKHLVDKYKDIKLVAAAYNAGETAVDRYKGIPPFKETRRYVKKFIDAYYGTTENRTIASNGKRIYTKPVRKIGNVYSNIGKSIW